MRPTDPPHWRPNASPPRHICSATWAFQLAGRSGQTYCYCFSQHAISLRHSWLIVYILDVNQQNAISLSTFSWLHTRLWRRCHNTHYFLDGLARKGCLESAKQNWWFFWHLSVWGSESLVQRMRGEGSCLFSYFPIGNSVGDFLVSSVGGTKHFTFIIIVHSSCRMTPKGMECLHKGYALGGLPRWWGGKESAFQCRRCGFDPWVEMIPWSRKWQPAPVVLPGKFPGQRSLVGYSPWSHKESNTTECPGTHICFKEENSIHSFIQQIPEDLPCPGSMHREGWSRWARQPVPILVLISISFQEG